MAKFGGIVLSTNLFDKPGQSGNCAVLVKVLTKDGVVNEPILVDIKREDLEFVKNLQNNGLETSAQVTFEANKILEWEKGVDRTLPAKESNGRSYPEQQVHSLYGYQKGSLSITRWVKEAKLVEETDATKIGYARRLSFATLMDKAIDMAKSVLPGGNKNS